MATKVDIGKLIVSRPGVKGGRPCLAGTGLPVHTVAVARTFHGFSPEEIVEELGPGIDLARVHAALAYYYANKDEIEGYLEADRRLGEELMAKYPRGWPPRPDPS